MGDMYPKRAQAVTFDLIRFNFATIGERLAIKTWRVYTTPKKTPWNVAVLLVKENHGRAKRWPI
jgi:hypothetical protein